MDKKDYEKLAALLAVDKEYFESVVPAAKSAGNDIWMQTQAALAYAVSLVGPRITGGIDISGNAPLIDALKQMVCLDAMRDTVAERDLILTANGFGVVSNANVAPASRERTAAFADSLSRSSSRRMDDIIDMMRASKGWADTPQAATLICSPVFLARHMAFAGKPKPVRDDIRAAAPLIAEAETAIIMAVGREQWEAFLAALRHSPVEPAEMAVWHLKVLRYIGGRLAGLNHHTMQALMRELLRYAEGNPDAFAPYMGSAEYEANHSEPYRNAKEDTAYFFG